ncbi:O-antigen ligase family protein [Pontibacter chitinilyticus]|uniref:O-antigen ligase family protein n=1 Tax=Pontibacter chitinilyticus TaxID=2674989 RepID=UPI00321B9013
MINRTNRLNALYILVLLVGYIIMSFLPDIMGGANSRLFTVPFRGVVLLWSLYILFRGTMWKGHQTFPALQWVFFFTFWALYVFRMVYDLYYVGIKATVFPNTSDYLLNAVGVCIIPAAAIRYADNVDYAWVLKWFFRLLMLALLTSLFLNLSNPLNEEVTHNGQYNGSSAMNTISYGHYGVTFALLSMFLFTRSEGLYKKLFYIACFFFGIFIMYLAGSRSPLVALLFCLLFFQINNTGIVKGLLFIMLLTVPLIIFSDQIIELLSGFGGSFINRVLSTINNGNSSGRDLLYAEAIKEILDSPIIGTSFLLQEGVGAGFYPHNMILESFMATGFIGGLILIRWILQGLFTSYRLISSSNPNAWVSVLFLQYLIYAMFSQAIYNNASFWYYSILILSVTYTTAKQNITELYRSRAVVHQQLA